MFTPPCSVAPTRAKLLSGHRFPRDGVFPEAIPSPALNSSYYSWVGFVVGFVGFLNLLFSFIEIYPTERKCIVKMHSHQALTYRYTHKVITIINDGEPVGHPQHVCPASLAPLAQASQTFLPLEVSLHVLEVFINGVIHCAHVYGRTLFMLHDSLQMNPAIHFSLVQNRVLLYEYVITCLSAHLLVDTWVASRFWLSTFMYQECLDHRVIGLIF